MKEKLFIAVILLLCLVPSVGMLLPKPPSETGGNEVLTPPPALLNTEGGVNTEFLPQLAGYVEDNYFLRQRLVSAWSALNQNVLHTSIASGVLLGQDGWLYFSDTLDDYTGTEPMSERDIFCAARNLALLREYCEQQGARFLFTIAPNKNSLYPEHMPKLTVTGAPRNAQRLMDALQAQGVPYLDLFALFRAQNETLYFTQDSHWNSKGAALAADAIAREISAAPSSYFQQPFLPKANHLSDLYSMLYPTGEWLETDQTYSGELSFHYDRPFRSPDDLTIQTSGGSGSASLVMFRDSFGRLLYPYLADTCRKALFSRSMPFKMELVQQQEADFVAVELVERNLDYLLQNVPAMPAPARALPAAERLDPPLQLETGSAQPVEGYLLITGTLPVTPDADSFVYLCAGNMCWEAFLLENDTFALYIPETDLDGLSVTFTVSGTAVCVPALY